MPLRKEGNVPQDKIEGVFDSWGWRGGKDNVATSKMFDSFRRVGAAFFEEVNSSEDSEG
jgi:hypothetical protein